VEVTKSMENFRKKNQTETQNSVEGHSSRIKQVGDRTSELKDKIKNEEQTEEMLCKQLKSCEKNVQEHANCIKRQNLRIMGFEEGKEVQAKGFVTQSIKL
jgi:septal ring factor EnvC (AmiA/AmiB activator)